MPLSDPIEQKAYQARYWRENRERLKIKRQLKAGSKQLTENAIRRERRRPRENATKRPQGQNYTERLFIPPTRGWDHFEGRLYFSSSLGYTLEDVEAILDAVHKGQNRPYIPLGDPDPVAQPSAPEKPAKRSRKDKTPVKPTSKKPSAPPAPARPKPKTKRKP